jgi:hypothetical protein
VDLRRAFHGICGIDRDHMFVHVIPVHMAEMAVVKIIHVAVMANRSVPAFRAMLMSVVGVVYLGACGPLAMLPVSAWLPIDAHHSHSDRRIVAEPPMPGFATSRLIFDM